MLGSIFGSVLRVKMLNLFLLSPEKKYQQRQLILDLGLPAASVRHELVNLIKFGLIKEELFNESKIDGRQKKEKKIYSANENFLLYPEIKALFTKAQILFSQKFITSLQKICQPKFLALTGLFTNYPEAQTDILVVSSIKRSVFLKLLHELEKDLGREINFTILSVKEFHYRENVMDIFLYNILEGKTLVLLDNIHKSS